jgi:uncharacterized protein YbjT (DUF2867 family)
MSRFVVMAASGKTGTAVCRSLLRAGHTVIAMGRTEASAQLLKKEGAQLAIGDPANEQFLAAHFDGADGVYALLPYDVGQPGYLSSQRRLGQALTRALQMSQVGKTVFLSSLGAEQAHGTGLIQSLHEQEARFAALGTESLLILRAGAFLENIGAQLDLMRSQGCHVEAIDEDRAVPMVCASDIADRVVHALTQESWQGHRIREVLGHGDISMGTVTRVLQEKLRMPHLRYVRLSYEDYAGRLREYGFAPDVAELNAELSRGINEGRIRSLHGRDSENTTPTSLAQYLDKALQAS